MSFMNINPNKTSRFYYYPQLQAGMHPTENAYAQNPYTASFYNQNFVYPFNPLYMPNTQKSYVSLGQINTPTGELVHLFQLNNGQKVAILPQKNKATIVKTFLDGGSMNETDRIRGISHCIEHCLFKGSSQLKDGDVFKLTSLMGASTNASTDFAKTDYYITAPYMSENNLKRTIEIQGDMISNPLFDETALQSEKGPICSEISMINDDPITIAFDRVIRNLFQIKSDSHNLVAGSIDTVSNLTKKDVTDHHTRYYTPENLYTVVVGDVDIDKTIDLISKNFTIKQNTVKQEQKREILTPINNSVREDIKTPKTNFTSVIMGFAGPKPQDSKDFVIFTMLNYYLSQCSSSDLKNNLEKISGDFSADVQKVGLKASDPYALICAMGLNPGEEQKGIDIFYDAIQKLQNQPLTDDEMTALKNYMAKAIELISIDSESTCDFLGSCFLDNSLDLFANYQGLTKNITKEDIMEFAKKYFDLNKVSMVVVHPQSVSTKDIQSNYKNSKYSLKTSIQNKPNSVVSFCGNPKITTQGVEEYKLANNTHLILNNTDSDLCVFNWSVNTPPVKPKNPNIPAVLKYMFQKGTSGKRQDELEKFKELNGIYADVFVNGRLIEINADCMTESVDKTLELILELMYNPTFSKKDFEAAKTYIKDNLKSSQKDATSNLLDNLYPGYFPTVKKMLETIDQLQLSDVEEFYNDLLKNASSIFTATVPFNRFPDLKNKIMSSQNSSEIIFKDPTPKLSPIFKANPQTNVIVDTDDLNQAQIYKSYKFPLSGNINDEATFEILNIILGGSPNSRLFSDLREKENLAYSVSSTIQSFENTGILTLKIQTTTDHKDQGVQSYENVEKSLEGFKKHATALCNELVSDEELEAAKMKLIQNVIGQMQNPLSQNSLLALNASEPFGLKRIDKYIDAINKITKEDIQKAANFIFSYNPTISILASQDTINSQMEYLKKQGKIETL